jgi:hypothetical protein
LRARAAQMEIADVGDTDRMRDVFHQGGGGDAPSTSTLPPVSIDTDEVEHRSQASCLPPPIPMLA